MHAIVTVYVHQQVPNVQTFDIIIDCCRHSLEEPSVIFEELKKLDLPTDYCYRAALCNAGNRIPTQVLYETMHNVANAPLPTDGRFERNVQRDKDSAMRLHGLLPPPEKARVAHYWHRAKRGTEFVQFNGKVKPAFDEDNSTILSYEETYSLGGADDGRGQEQGSTATATATAAAAAAAAGGGGGGKKGGRTALKEAR